MHKIFIQHTFAPHTARRRLPCVPSVSAMRKFATRALENFKTNSVPMRGLYHILFIFSIDFFAFLKFQHLHQCRKYKDVRKLCNNVPTAFYLGFRRFRVLPNYAGKQCACFVCTSKGAKIHFSVSACGISVIHFIGAYTVYGVASVCGCLLPCSGRRFFVLPHRVFNRCSIENSPPQCYNIYMKVLPATHR